MPKGPAWRDGLHHWGRIWQSSDELWSPYWERSWIILWLMATFQIPSKDRRLGLVNLFGWLCLDVFFSGWLYGRLINWFFKVAWLKVSSIQRVFVLLVRPEGLTKTGFTIICLPRMIWISILVHNKCSPLRVWCYSLCSDVVGRWWSDTRWIWAASAAHVAFKNDSF